MLKFTEAIEIGTVKKIPNTDDWLVKEPFIFYLDYETKNEVITVPNWFKTNFGSIPRLFWWLFNPTWYVSYVYHDHLYGKEWYITIHDDSKISDFSKELLKQWYYHWETYANIDITSVRVTRKSADKILDLWLEVEWMSKRKRTLVYAALRLFWWKNFTE